MLQSLIPHLSNYLSMRFCIDMKRDVLQSNHQQNQRLQLHDCISRDKWHFGQRIHYIQELAFVSAAHQNSPPWPATGQELQQMMVDIKKLTNTATCKPSGEYDGVATPLHLRSWDSAFFSRFQPFCPVKGSYPSSCWINECFDKLPSS